MDRSIDALADKILHQIGVLYFLSVRLPLLLNMNDRVHSCVNTGILNLNGFCIAEQIRHSGFESVFWLVGKGDYFFWMMVVKYRHSNPHV